MTKMLKAIEVALPTSYLHPITSQAHSYPYTTLNFSVSQIHVNAFGILGKQCKKKSLMLSKEGGRITMQFHTFIAFHFAFVWDYRSHETPKKASHWWIKRLIARELHQTRGLKFLCVACLVSKKKEHASGMLGAECISNVYSLGSQGL